MNKSERKYFNTAIKMNDALIELLNKKQFEYITVKEICSLSKVNRSTFYLHYEGLNDLLLETVEYVNSKFLSYFANISFDENLIFTAPKEFLNFITPEFLIPWLTFIKENSIIYSTVLKRLDTLKLDEVYSPIIKKIVHPILDRYNIKDEDKNYVLYFYLEGLNAIVKEWIRNDCKKDIEKISKIIIDCVMANENKSDY